MSDSAFADRIFTASWTDYRQQRMLRKLGSEVSTLSSSLYRQRSGSSLLRSQIAELQGSLEERLTTLSVAFDAFVELSDIRDTLALFDAPALVRHRTRQVLAAIGEPGGVAAPVPLPHDEDTAGYWLLPATRALGELIRGADPAADIAAAQALDPRRTALLITATAALVGHHDIAVAWLSTALGQFVPGVPLDAARRLLWCEAANGAFGAAGVAEIEARLQACAAGIDDALRDALKANIVNGDALGAARRLSALRALCEVAVPEDPPVPPGSAGPAGSAGSAGAVGSRSVGGAAALGALVRQLVDEGTEEERPLLRRSEELRAVIENRAGHDVGPRFDAEAGTPEKFLVDDAADATNGAVGVLARRVVADQIRAIAASLAVASRFEPPAETTARLRTGAVRITLDGPDQGDLKKVRAAAEGEHPPIVVADPATWILGGAGLVVLIGGFLISSAGAVLGVLIGAGMGVGAAVRVVGRRSRQRERDGQRERAGRDVVRRADEAWTRFVSSTEALKQVIAGAVADNEAVHNALKV